MMSDAVQIALITSLTTGIPSVLAMIFAALARKNSLDAANTARDTQAIAVKTEQNTNHLKDELVAAVKDATAQRSHAEGKAEGMAEQKAKNGESH